MYIEVFVVCITNTDKTRTTSVKLTNLLSFTKKLSKDISKRTINKLLLMPNEKKICPRIKPVNFNSRLYILHDVSTSASVFTTAFAD